MDKEAEAVAKEAKELSIQLDPSGRQFRRPGSIQIQGADPKKFTPYVHDTDI